MGKNLFAGGDSVTGPSTVVQAVASGREAATLIELSFKSYQTFDKEGGTEPEFSSPSLRQHPGDGDQPRGGVSLFCVAQGIFCNQFGANECFNLWYRIYLNNPFLA